MHIVFANPEPTLLVTDRLMTDRTLPIHHAHCSGVTAEATRAYTSEKSSTVRISLASILHKGCDQSNKQFSMLWSYQGGRPCPGCIPP
jgi:hypothetical protein